MNDENTTSSPSADAFLANPTETPAAAPAAPAAPAKASRAKAAPAAAAPVADAEPETVVAEQARLMRDAKRVKIVLEANANIPPTGQYIGVNGTGYLLLPGKEVEVPEFILDVLDAAVEHRPVMNEQGNIAGYEAFTRYPYRIVRS